MVSLPSDTDAADVLPPQAAALQPLPRSSAGGVAAPPSPSPEPLSPLSPEPSPEPPSDAPRPPLSTSTGAEAYPCIFPTPEADGTMVARSVAGSTIYSYEGLKSSNVSGDASLVPLYDVYSRLVKGYGSVASEGRLRNSLSLSYTYPATLPVRLDTQLLPLFFAG